METLPDTGQPQAEQTPPQAPQPPPKRKRVKRAGNWIGKGTGGGTGEGVAKNIAELCKAVGISADTYHNYKNHVEAPAKAWNGYYVKGWKEFLRKHGISTVEKRESQQELKAELTRCDIELRKLEIQKQKGELISKQVASETITRHASIVKQFLDSIPLQFEFLKNEEVSRIAEKVKADGYNFIKSELGKIE